MEMRSVSRREVLKGALLIAGAGLAGPPCRARAEEKRTGRILYSRQAGERIVLHVMNADGTEDRELRGQTAGQNVFPTWSPDGKRVGYTAADGEETIRIVLAEPDGSNGLTVQTGSQRSGLPAWSRDGKRLAYASGEMDPAVYAADAEGNGARQVSPQGGRGAFPFWTADGESIGYLRFGENRGGSLMLAKADGSSEKVLLESDHLLCPGPNALSPDGKRVALVAINPERRVSGFRVFDLETKAESTVMEVDGAGYGMNLFTMPIPAWSPDGKHLLLALPGEKGRGLYQVSLDGKEKVRLTPEGVDCVSGAWIRG